jgi:predicted ATPase
MSVRVAEEKGGGPMRRIRKVHIGGFKRLFNLDLDMRSLMVMVGANGVGKTSLLEALSLLAASAAGNLNAELNQIGGLFGVLTYDKGSDLNLSVDMEVHGYEPLCYSLDIVPKGQSYAIASEILSQERGYPDPFKHIDSHYDDIRYTNIDTRRLTRPNWEYNPFETSLSQVPKLYQEPEELRSILSSSTRYHVLDVGPRSPVKLPQQMKPAVLPGKDGEDLISLLYYLRETGAYASRYEAVEDALRSAFPFFDHLSFPPVAAGMLAMTWKDTQFSKPLYMNQLSEGMLRFLWLVSLLQSPGLSTVTMIDEPEVSLHPELLSLLADLMREAAERTHLIIATHSDRLVRFMRPEEVVVMNILEDGTTAADWADTMDLERWLKEYSLDEVWRMGRMGGRA